jgi:hypothetical protein
MMLLTCKDNYAACVKRITPKTPRHVADCCNNLPFDAQWITIAQVVTHKKDLTAPSISA